MQLDIEMPAKVSKKLFLFSFWGKIKEKEKKVDKNTRNQLSTVHPEVQKNLRNYQKYRKSKSQSIISLSTKRLKYNFQNIIPGPSTVRRDERLTFLLTT